MPITMERVARHDIESKFGSFRRVYLSTTENLSGYIPTLVSAGSRVLCVGGSGDHILNSVLCGANDVVAFDVNYLSGVWFQLKRRLILTLSRKNFLSALHRLSSFPFFTSSSSTLIPLEERNLYLSTDAYYQKLQLRLRRVRVRWIFGEVEDTLRRLPNHSFDTILLSNIADYCSCLRHFSQRVIGPALMLLTSRGTVATAYLYNIGYSTHSEVDDQEIRRKAFAEKSGSYTEFRFSGAYSRTRDGVGVLTL
jgi:hypothetical protein